MHTLASNMFYLPEIDESKAKRTILPVRTPSNPTRVPLAATYCLARFLNVSLLGSIEAEPK